MLRRRKNHSTRTEPVDSSAPVTHRDRGLLLIAIFKFSKVALLLAIGFGVLQLLRPEVADRAQAWAAELALNDEREVLQYLVEGASGLSDATLKAYGFGAFFYAALFFVEGVGLYLERRWAEYLTVVATASFIPIELYELWKHVGPIKIGVLLLNIVILGYLIYRLRSKR